jgi:hypothetical protein
MLATPQGIDAENVPDRQAQSELLKLPRLPLQQIIHLLAAL